MPSRRMRRSKVDGTIARNVPFVGALARFFERLALRRAGRVPVGLLALLPVAILVDAFDAVDELALGPVGIAASFVLESAFLLAITGSAAPAFAFAAIDVLPVIDTIPFATIVLVVRIVQAWGAPEASVQRGGRVIDV